eukprot:jgi/Mesvir1/24670/Mv21964-RA.1
MLASIHGQQSKEMTSPLRSVRLLLAVALVVVILRTLLYLPSTPTSQPSSLRPTTSSNSLTGDDTPASAWDDTPASAWDDTPAGSASHAGDSNQGLLAMAATGGGSPTQGAVRGGTVGSSSGGSVTGGSTGGGGSSAIGGAKTAAWFVAQAIVPDEDPVVLSSASVDTSSGQEPILHFLSMTGASHSQMTLERAFLKHLPAADHPRRHFASCAVVGNSGSLLRSKSGKAIDAHEAVLRFNYAPVHPYEDDVGRKTTFDFCNRENARRILHASKGFRFRSPPSTLLFFEFSSPTNRKICNEVHLYGFEAYVSKKTAKAPYHYFDKVEGVTEHHSFDFAIYAYQLLGEGYPLYIH